VSYTIDDHESAKLEQQAAARRRKAAKTAEIRVLLEQAERDGRTHLNAAEDARIDVLRAERDRASDELGKIARQLARIEAARDEMAEQLVKMNEIHPTGARLPQGRSAALRIGSGAPAPADSGPRWVRSSDGRPAVVERGQRIASNEVVAEQIARAAERDRHIVGMHGGLGSLVRSMSTTSGSAVVPTVWAADVIDRARALAAVVQAGAEIIPMDAKVVQIGRLTADPTASFRAEGSTITATDPTFDNVTLTATTLSALVVGSLEWFQDTTPGGGADQLIGEALAKQIALAIDTAALMGGVTAGGEGVNLPNPPNPRGILATLLAVASSSVLGGLTNGTAQTAATPYNEIIDTLYTPRDNNEAPNAMIWPSRLARKYAEFYDTTNQPMRMPPDVEQIQKFVSNQVPSGFAQGTGTTMADLFVGDFRQLLIGQRLDLQIQTLTERYAELGQIGIVATWRGDIQLARPRAFSVFRYLKGV
jgi:HK97 family phage major capsid protein